MASENEAEILGKASKLVEKLDTSMEEIVALFDFILLKKY